jgi:hypothetical protein
MNFSTAHNDYLDPERYLNHAYDDGDDTPVLTPSQKGQVTRLRREIDRLHHLCYQAPRTPITVSELFQHAPDGDFNWEGEAEDVGNAWNCGESDCPHGWHKSSQSIEQGRENGKTWFIVLDDSHSDGDAQPCDGWDEREGDTVTDSLLSDLWSHLQGRTIDHFSGWASYCLDVAVTGQDPLDNWFREYTVDDCIKAARDNIKYLRNIMKRQMA